MSFFKKIRFKNLLVSLSGSPEGVEKRTDHSVRLEVRQLSESLMQQGTAPLIAL